ncbi:hypothetical protein MTR_7g081280 [Medicago truncatula]|uniref:Uncharacterized protein n=1 Tax=Medicago truncatula TaxID=3880 RepID=G7KTD8_MEDTR|nr:hypothetical protein MTR_7g081280 [Medicago truncatula]
MNGKKGCGKIAFPHFGSISKRRGKKVWGGTHTQNLSLLLWTENTKKHQHFVKSYKYPAIASVWFGFCKARINSGAFQKQFCMSDNPNRQRLDKKTMTMSARFQEEHKLTPSSHEKKIRTDKLTIPRPEADWLWDRVNGFGLASLLQTKH